MANLISDELVGSFTQAYRWAFAGATGAVMSGVWGNTYAVLVASTIIVVVGTVLELSIRALFPEEHPR